MDLKKTILLGLFMLMSAAGYSQDAIQQISAAFRSADTAALELLLDDKVQIAVNGQQQLLSRKEAGKEIALFFTKNNPSGFSVIHQSRKGQSQYMIGRLDTESGGFRVYCLISTDKNRNKIAQIRIEKL
ncbi:MAG: DUF4783 domain-containing protein [Coprobacter sp.]|nr:DUF4783 domain-containing protein [Coprobacter sp.]